MSATRFGKAPECPEVHTDVDAASLALALIAERPGDPSLIPIAAAMTIALGSPACVDLDADERRAIRAWKRAVQPRRAVTGSTRGAVELLLTHGLVDWTESGGYVLTPEGAERLAKPEMEWWRWEAKLFVPIAERRTALLKENDAARAAGGAR